MKSKYFYLLSLLLVLVIPSFIAGFFVLSSISLKALATFVVLVTVTGNLWDLWGTRHGKADPLWVWSFNVKNTLGVRIFGVPVEEYIFYVFSSTYIVFIWKTIELASMSGNESFYTLLLMLGVWALISVAILHKLSPKGDKLIG